MPSKRRLFMRLRGARRLALRAAAVIDAPANRLNGRNPCPPIWMRREVGPLIARTNEVRGAGVSARWNYRGVPQ